MHTALRISLPMIELSMAVLKDSFITLSSTLVVVTYFPIQHREKHFTMCYYVIVLTFLYTLGLRNKIKKIINPIRTQQYKLGFSIRSYLQSQLLRSTSWSLKNKTATPSQNATDNTSIQKQRQAAFPSVSFQRPQSSTQTQLSFSSADNSRCD